MCALSLSSTLLYFLVEVLKLWKRLGMLPSMSFYIHHQFDVYLWILLRCLFWGQCSKFSQIYCLRIARKEFAVCAVDFSLKPPDASAFSIQAA